MGSEMCIRDRFFLLTYSIALSQATIADEKFNKELKGLLSHSVKEVIPQDVVNNKDVLFLDSRELEEFETSHIKNAIFIGYDKFDMNRLNAINKDKKIVVYCSVGYRSEKIAEKLEKAGFKDVSNLYGGIFEWVNNEEPVYDKNGETEKVHTYNKQWSKWLKKGKKIY